MQRILLSYEAPLKEQIAKKAKISNLYILVPAQKKLNATNLTVIQ